MKTNNTKKVSKKMIGLSFVTAMALMGGGISATLGALNTLSADAAVQITTVDQTQGEQNELRNKIHVDLSVPSESESEIDLTDSEQSDWYSASNHKIGQLNGSAAGLTLIPSKGVQYDRLADGKATSAFYTSLSNHSRGYAKVTLTLDKLKAGELIDLYLTFRDTGAGNTWLGKTDFTKAYNALSRGENQKITAWVDLSTVSSLDYLAVYTTASKKTASYLIRNIDIEWGSSVVSSAESALINKKNTENIVFSKMVSTSDDGASYRGSVPGFTSGLGDWGPITAHNNADGEYITYTNGSDVGFWLLTSNFNSDVVNESHGGKVNVSVTIRKKLAGNVGMVRFRILDKTCNYTKDAVVDFDTDNGAGNSYVDEMAAGEWVTLSTTVDTKIIENYDSVHLYVRALDTVDPVEGQEVDVKNICLSWGDNNTSSIVREQALTEDENEIDGLAYESTAGVKVASDYLGTEYTAYDFGSMTQNKTSASYRGNNLSAGKYATALTFRKTAELSSSFSLSMAAAKSGTAVVSKELTAKIKEAPVGEWVTVMSDEYELADKAANGFTVALQGAAGDALQVKDYSIIRTAEYIAKDRTFGVSSELVRDFTAIESMGVTEFDFSQNGFPEAGNWSDSFPAIRTDGQKIVYEDGVPAMKNYRRTQEEIDEAKVLYNWPEATEENGIVYVPRDESHFFFTAPISAGYATITMRVKPGTNFKGTDEFSLDGYQGSEPWWKLVSFTDEVNAATKGEWITLSADIYLPKAIDSIKVRISTREFDSDIYIQELRVITKSDAASLNYVASEKNAVSFALVLGNTTISSVTTGGESLDSSAYTIADGKFTLKQEYLDTLTNGTYDYVLSNGTDSITLSVFVSGVAPVITSDSFTVKTKSLEDVTLDVDYKNSGVNSVSIGETLLEEGVHYDANTDEGKLTIYKAAFESLEKGEYTLKIATRAGETQIGFTVEGKGKGCSSEIGSAGIAAIAGVALTGVAVAGVLIIKKKKKGVEPEQK